MHLAFVQDSEKSDTPPSEHAPLELPSVEAVIETPKPVESAASAHEHEIVDTALASIDSLLNASVWVLAVFGGVMGLIALILALLALFGWGAIKSTSVQVVKRGADEALEVYLASDEFNAILEDKIQEGVERRWQANVVAGALTTPERVAGEDNAFPSPEG